MKRGPMVTAVIAFLAMGAVVMAFTKSASPYVTITEARSTAGDHMHVAGELVKESLHSDVMKHTVEFTLTDPTGKLDVVYTGEPQPNLPEATKVVAVGGMEGDKFISHQLLVKCPSKYEAKDKK